MGDGITAVKQRDSPGSPRLNPQFSLWKVFLCMPTCEWCV